MSSTPVSLGRGLRDHGDGSRYDQRSSSIGSSGLGDHRLDRAAMIEQASRGLRQQASRNRDRPRSKGSQTKEETIKDARAAAWMAAVGSPPPQFGQFGDAELQFGFDSAQRRIRSVENDRRLLAGLAASASPGGGTSMAALRGSPADVEGEGSGLGHGYNYLHPAVAAAAVSTPASAWDRYQSLQADDDSEDMPPVAAVGSPLEEVAQPFPVEELKRPLSRKKDPSASAAAGLGALSNPARVNDAFEQRKTRQPIPIESWGPRPPSRQVASRKATPLDAALDEETKIISSSSRSRPAGAGSASGISIGIDGVGVVRPSSKAGGDQLMGSKVVGGTWAAARDSSRGSGQDTRGRQRKVSNRSDGSSQQAREDLGVFGAGARSPSQSLSKSFSGALFDGSQFRDGDLGAGPGWSSEFGELEVSGFGLADQPVTAGADRAGYLGAASPAPLAPWPGSPAGSCGGSPPTRKGRHSVGEVVSVEDVEADTEQLGLERTYGGQAYRRDATPPQVIINRRGEPRRGSDRKVQRERDKEGGQKMPFSTSLDAGFLSLFAS